MPGQFKVDKKYTHFAVRKSDNKIVNGWHFIRGFDKVYTDMDLKDMDIKPSSVKIFTTNALKRKGINPFDWNNWKNNNETQINASAKVDRVIHLKSGDLKRKPVPNDLVALTGYKYTDSDTDLSRGGKEVEYWNARGFKKQSAEYRKPALALRENFFSKQPYDTLVNVYQWKGVEFGNWTTNEDRYNYLIALIICSHDLNKVCNFKDNLGLWHTIHIAFGARGQGKALAHFEPSTFAINLTRYKRADKHSGDKDERFLHTGGIGSLAHEYGHALDYFYGQFVEKTTGISLSAGRTTETNFYQLETKGNSLHAQMNRIIQTCIWKSVDKQIHTEYHKTLHAYFQGQPYWFQHNEIWARLFEQFVQYQLEKKKINNTFLAKRKYADSRYLPAKEFKRVLPLVKKLIATMAKTAIKAERK